MQASFAATAVAVLAGSYASVWRVPMRSLIAAVAGAPRPGYGARRADGCHIGAYFRGVLSGSLHAGYCSSPRSPASWSERGRTRFSGSKGTEFPSPGS
ncbi:hypothetical protein Bphy_4640 [Paraburkholderia phymatum STM815]|uniref:Uncharacterized protein n=1 Tax=Paraburkholderia phymatum (strain DSM 17167 / CIP 108236 / LMG 21445 / STM815) TaxID=391038 RepID=B2JR84_PARP8|nr:hypothetical protein Bphy_4640 [Paraburkholderia phymatum STM815]